MIAPQNVLVLSLTLALAGAAGAAIHHVSPSGDDNPPHDGSAALPWKTIQKAANVVNPGDTVLIHGGTYREQVKFNRSGTIVQPIEFRPFDDGSGPEEVIVSGMDLVTPGVGGTGTWQQVAGDIYKIQLPEPPVLDPGENILFSEAFVAIDGVVQAEARWPNGNKAVDFHLDQQAIAEDATFDLNSAGPQYPFTGSDFYTATYTDDELPAFTNLDGALITLCPNEGVRLDTGAITDVSGTTLTFRYSINAATNNFQAQPGDPFFLWNHLDLLDTEGEAFLDKLGVNGPEETLYIWNPPGMLPSARTVETRTRRNVLVFENASHLHFEGIKTTAGSILVEAPSSHITFDRIETRYGGNGLNRTIGVLPVMEFLGSNCAVRNSTIADSFGAGIQERGANNTIENNCIHNVASYAVKTLANTGGTVHRNTAFDCAGRIIQIDGAASTFTHNHCYRAGLLLSDQAIINTIYDGDLLDSEIAYNWAHTNLARKGGSAIGGSGIRLAGAANNIAIHHNIVWNHTNAVSFKIRAVWENYPNYLDSKVRVYNNTFEGDVSAQESEVAPESSLLGLDMRNNIVARIVNSGNKPAPDFDTATIENNVFIQEFQVNPLAGNPVGGVEFVSGATGNFYPTPTSPRNNTADVIPPYTDGYCGSGPEHGALEFVSENGKRWGAGAVILEEHLAGLSIAAEPPADGLPIFRVDGLPLGRTFPDAFTVKIGGVTSNDFRLSYDVENHLATAWFEVPASGLSGVQTVMWSLDGVTYSSQTTTVDLDGAGGLSLASLTPPSADPAGGSVHTLTGTGFSTGNTFSIPVVVNHSLPRDFNRIPVPCLIDTSAPQSGHTITENNLLFTRPETGEVLDYWIDSGLGGPTTVFWVRHKENVLSKRFSHRDESTIHLTYGDPTAGTTSDQAAISEYFDFLDLDLVLRLTANSLNGLPDGTGIETWADESGNGNQPLFAPGEPAATRPLLKTDGLGGLPTLVFDGVDDYMFLDTFGPTDPSSGDPVLTPYTYLVLYKPESLLMNGTSRIVFSTEKANTTPKLNVKARSVPTPWDLLAVRPTGERYLSRIRVGRGTGGNSYHDGEIAELMMFAERLDPDTTQAPVFNRLEEFVSRKYALIGNGRGTGDAAETFNPDVPRIRIGGATATNVSVLSATSVQFTAPPGIAGSNQPVEVTTGGTTETLIPGLQYTGWGLTYPAWSAALPPGEEGSGQDPDTDGLSNLLEYAQDLDGDLNDSTLGPTFLPHSSDCDVVVYRFRVNALMTDAILYVDTTSDLQTWTRFTPDALGAVVAEADPDGDGTARVLEITFPLSSRLFFARLYAELPE